MNHATRRFVQAAVLAFSALLVASAQAQGTISSPTITVTDNNGGTFDIGDTVTIDVSFVYTPPSPTGGALIDNALDISLTLPSGLSATGTPTCSRSPTTYSEASGTINCSNTGWTGIDLNPADTNGDQTYTLSVTATIQPQGSFDIQAALQNIVNTVPTPAPSSATDTSIVPVDLSLALSASPAGPVSLGTTVTFTGTISNASTRAASGVAWQAVLPSGYTLNTGSAILGVGLNVPAGGSVTFSFDATAGVGVADTDYLVRAQITAQNEPDVDSTSNNGVTAGEDDDDSLFVLAVQEVDLDLSFSNPSAPPSVDVGVDQVYELTLLNNGPSELGDADFVLYVPDGYGIDVASATASGATIGTGGKCAAGAASCSTLTWNVTGLAANASVKRTVTLTPTAGNASADSFLLIAEVERVNSANGLSYSPLETPGNYPSNPSENDEDTLSLLLADLGLSLTVNNGTLNPYTGSTVPVSVFLRNSGARNSGAVKVCVLLDSGFVNVDIAGVSGLSTGTAGCSGVEWTVTDVTSATQQSVTFNVDVGATGPYSISAEVISEAAPDVDSVPGNGVDTEDDQQTVTLTPIQNADLSLSMSVDDPTPVVGDTITFSLKLDNAGPNDVTGVTLTNTVPDGFGSINASASGGVVNGNQVTWTGLAVNANASLTVSFSVVVLAGGSSYLNTAEITASGLDDRDSTPGNGDTTEDDYAELNVPPPLVDLVVTAEGTPSPATAVAGGTLRYAFRVSNASSISAPGATVTDLPPLYQNSGDAGFDAASMSWTCEAYNGACCVASGSATQCGASPNPISISGSTLNGYAVDLPANSYLIFRASGTVDARSAIGPAQLVNQVSAQVNANQTENVTANNTNIDVLGGVAVTAEADLSVVKTLQEINCPLALAKAQVDPNYCAYSYYETVFEIRVRNDGPSKVVNATVTDDPDSAFGGAGVDHDYSWTCSITQEGNAPESSCTPTGNALRTVSTPFTLDNALTLMPGAEATYILTIYTNTDTGRAVNTASVEVPADVTETNNSNNSDDALVGLSGIANLSVSMSAPASVVAGESISWSMLISNTPDSDDALGTRITDLFPSQVENVQWSCSAVTPIPGDLSQIALETSPDVVTPVDLAFSRQGDQVYVVSSGTDSIVVYRREVVQGGLFGSLTLIDTERQGVNSDNGQAVDGMILPVAVAISPDQRFVYVVSQGDATASPAVDPAVTWFTRDSNPLSAQYGKLSYAGSMTLSATPQAVLASPDGEHLYVLAAGSLWIYDRNPALGALSNQRQVLSSGGNSMRWLGGGSHLVVSSTAGTAVYARDNNANSTNFGDLTALPSNTGSVSGDHHSLQIHPEEKWLLVGRGASVEAYEWDADTETLKPTPVVRDVVDNLNNPRTVQSLHISPDGEHVLVAANGFLGYYRMDLTTGVLSVQALIIDSHDNQVAGFSPDGRHLIASYVDGGSGLRIYDRKAPDPILNFMEQDRQGDSSGGLTIDGLTGATALAMRADGQSLFAVGISGQGSLVTFRRDENKGKEPNTAGEHLVYASTVLGGAGAIPSMRDVFDMEEMNGFLYLASQADNRILIFSLSNTSLPVYVGEVTDSINLAGVTGLAVDRARNVLYAVSLYSDSVVAYQADTSTGALSQIQVIRNADPGVFGLDGAFQVALTPDSATGAPGHLLVVSSIADQLVAFSRDNNGQLQFEAAYANVGDRPLAVTASSDGRHVYVGAANSHSITVVSRVADSNRADYGNLAVVGQYVNGLGGVTGIRGIRGLALSPDDRRLYVAGEIDGTLSVFDRNDEETSPEFGLLTQVLVHEDNLNGVDGLEQIYSVMVSPDGRYVYSAALADNAVASFSQGTGSRCPASGTGDINELLVDVAAGGNLRFEVTADVLSSATVGNLVNTMTVTDPDGFTDSTPVVSDTATTTLETRVDLQVSKTDGRVSATAGESLTYEIVVRNQGPSDAIHMQPASVLLTDVLDAAIFDTTQVSWQCEATGSGRLTLRDIEYDGVDQADGLAGASAVAIAPPLNGNGGTYVYATGLLEDALSVFRLDTGTGHLSFVQVLRADAGNPLVGASDVQVSADGRYVFVSAQISDAVSVYEASEAGGFSLTLRGSLTRADHTGLDQAVALSRVADNGDLYVAGARNSSLVHLNWNGTAFSVISAYTNNSGGVVDMQGPVDVLLSSLGDRVVVAAPASNAVVFFTRSATTGMLGYQTAVRDGDVLSGQTVSGLAGVSSVEEVIQGSQSYVYLAGRDADTLTVLTMTDVAGTSDWVQTLVNGQGLSNMDGPVRMAASPDGLHLYVASVNSASLSQFGIGADGTLRLQQQLLASDGQPGLTRPNGLNFSVDGRFMAAVSGDSNAVVLYQRRADTLCPDSGGHAELTAGVPITVARGGEIRLTLQVAVRADVTTPVENTAEVSIGDNTLERNDTDNTATDTDQLDQRADLSIRKWDEFNQYDGLRGVLDLAFTSDGNRFYTAGYGDNALGVWDNSGSSAVFVQALRNNTLGNSGFNGIAALALSPDDAFLYAVSSLDNALMTLRVETDGTLTQLQDLRDDGVIQGLAGAVDVLVSPDGAHVYVLGRTLGSVAVFERDTASGTLRFQSVLRNGLNGVQGMGLPDAMTISADGDQLYVVSKASNALVVLDRGNDSQVAGYGDLGYLASYVSGANGVVDMLGPQAVWADAGNRYVYVAASDSEAIVWLERQTDGSLVFTGSLTAQAAGTSVEFADLRALVGNVAGDVLYALSGSGNALNRLTRNTDGSLVPDQLVREGDATTIPTVSVHGLRGGRALYLDENRNELWSAAADSSALAEWDVATGLMWDEALVDEGGGAAPGATATYHIVVTNHGPAKVVDARVQDVFPLAFTTINWTCSQVNTICIPSGSGDLDTLVTLEPGQEVEFVAVANISTEAVGRVVNTATVTAPANVLDPDVSNNRATDENTVLIPAVDVSVTLDNAQLALESGQSVSYVMTLTNHGPSHANNVTARLQLPEGVGFSSWSCSASPLPGVLQDAMLNAGDLNPVRAMVLSSDQNDLYVVGVEGVDDVLAHYRRDQRTGELVQLTVIRNNHVFNSQNISNMDGVSDVVISPDGLNVYVAAPDADAILLFRRNPVDGSLSLAGSWIDQVAGVDGLAGVHDLEMSADGGRLYALANLDDAVTRFDVLPGGQLSWRQSLFSGVYPDVEQSVALGVAENGRDLYLLTALDRLVVLQHDTAGDLQILASQDLSSLNQFGNPVDLRLIRGEDALLVLGGANGGNLLKYLRNADGSLILQDNQLLSLTTPQSMLPLEDGQQVLIADSGSISVWEDSVVGYSNILSFADNVQAKVMVSNALERLLYLGNVGIQAVNRLQGSRCTDFGYGSILDQVSLAAGGGQAVYTLNTSVSASFAGVLSMTGLAQVNLPTVETNAANNVAVDTDPVGSIPTLAGTVSIDNTLVAGQAADYTMVVDNTGNADAMGETLAFTLPWQPGDADGFDPAETVLQCTGSAPLVWVQLDGDTRLVHLDRLLGSDDGNYVYGLDGSNGHLYSWSVNAGIVQPHEQLDEGQGSNGLQVTGLLGARAMVLSPDGQNLYVLASSSNSILVFRRNVHDGTLALIQHLDGASGNVVNLVDPRDMVITPDGLHAFVASAGADTINRFDRDPVSGILTWAGQQRDGFDSIFPASNVLRGVNSLVLADEGRVLYATASTSDTVAAFLVDGVTGALNYQQVVRNNASINTPTSTQILRGLVTPDNLKSSLQGRYLYLLSQDSGTLFVFSRVPGSTELTLIQTLEPGVNGVPTHSGPYQLAFNGDASRVYVLASGSAELLVFRRSVVDGELQLLQVMHDGDAVDPHLGQALDLLPLQSTDNLLLAGEFSGLYRWRENGFASCAKTLYGASAAQQVVDLEKGASLTLKLAAGQLPPERRSDVTLTLTVDDATGVNLLTTSRTDTPEVHTDLIVNMLQSDGRTVAGEPLQITVQISNGGPSSVLDGSLDLVFNGQWSPTDWTCTDDALAACDIASGTGAMPEQLVNLPPGSQLSYVFNGALNPGFINQSLSFTATGVTEAGAVENDLLDDTASLTLTITGEADVAVSGSVDAIWIPGTSTQVVLDVVNHGPSHSNDSTMTLLSLPAPLVVNNASCTAAGGAACPFVGNTLPVPPVQFSLPVGGSIQMIIDGIIPSSAVQAGSTVELVVLQDQTPLDDVQDPVTGNNSLSAPVTIQPTGDLGITAMVDSEDPYDTLANNRQPLRYTIDWFMSGPSDAVSPEIRLTVPTALVLSTGTGCSQTGNQVVCPLPDTQAVDLPLTGTLVVPFDTSSGLSVGQGTVQAEIMALQVDSNPTDNVREEVTIFQPGVDLETFLVQPPAWLMAGDSFSLQFDVENHGSADVGTFSLQMDLDQALLSGPVQLDLSACPGCSQSSSNPLVVQGPINGLERLSIVVNATLDANLDVNVNGQLDITATASVVLGDADKDTGNNTVQRSLTISDIRFSDGFEEP